MSSNAMFRPSVASELLFVPSDLSEDENYGFVWFIPLIAMGVGAAISGVKAAQEAKVRRQDTVALYQDLKAQKKDVEQQIEQAKLDAEDDDEIAAAWQQKVLLSGMALFVLAGAGGMAVAWATSDTEPSEEV